MSGTPAGGTARSREVRELIEPIVSRSGLDLEDVRVETAGRRRLVRIVVDGDGGVTLDAVTEVSQGASAALDAADLIGGSYMLEVTSPGVDRPLTAPRHWRRAAGRLVAVTFTKDAGGRKLTGRVEEADDEAALLRVDGAAEPVRVPYADVAKARVQVEFNRPKDEAGGDAADDELTDDELGEDADEEELGEEELGDDLDAELDEV
jgi:ribosome maturation factor RimP